MHKDQIQKIIKFYEADDSVIQYLIKTDDFQGYKKILIEENDNGEHLIYNEADDFRVGVWEFIKDCNFDDFRFYKRVELGG